MTDKNKELQLIKQLLDAAEGNIRQAKSLLFAAEINKKAKNLEQRAEGSAAVEGVFDGESMVAPEGKKYPVPANYASKSKLIPGDVLKLTIFPDGSFVFKQISPIPRKKLIGGLEEIESGKFIVSVGERKYKVLHASVTYFRAQSGDKMTVIVPEEGETEWAAVENKI